MVSNVYSHLLGSINLRSAAYFFQSANARKLEEGRTADVRSEKKRTPDLSLGTVSGPSIHHVLITCKKSQSTCLSIASTLTVTKKCKGIQHVKSYLLLSTRLLRGPHIKRASSIKRTPAWVPKFSCHIYRKSNLYSADPSIKRTRTPK